MSLSALDRRTLLQSGAMAASVFALAGWTARPGMPQAGPLQPGEAAIPPGALLAWLQVGSEGGTLRLLAFTGGVAQEVGAETLPPMPLAAAGRHASAAAVLAAARGWGVPSRSCDCAPGLIRHEPSGRSRPYAIWTDFV